MIVLFVAAALASTAPAPAACPDVVTAEAFVCRALTEQKAGNPAAAAAAFEQAAQAAPDKEPAAARMLAAAGNMWIAANQPGKAALALDRALALTGLRAEQRGQALLDRARVAAAQNDLRTARAKVNEAAATIAADPYLWYFSASLAIREDDKAAAEASIGKALALAPSDAAILFEAGHVAQFTGDNVGARDYWVRASARDPNGPIGKAARDALKLLPAPLTVKAN